MPTRIFDSAVNETIAAARLAAREHQRRTVLVDGVQMDVPAPFPSPADWRDSWIYFLLLDRFNNDLVSPAGTWNHRCDHRLGLGRSRRLQGFPQEHAVCRGPLR